MNTFKFVIAILQSIKVIVAQGIVIQKSDPSAVYQTPEESQFCKNIHKE